MIIVKERPVAARALQEVWKLSASANRITVEIHRNSA